MKIKLVIIIAIGLIIYQYICLKPADAQNSNSMSHNMNGDFLIGGLHDAADKQFTYLSVPLSFNLWHSYVFGEDINGKKYPRGRFENGAPNDRLFTESADYVSEYQNTIRNVAANEMKLLLQRPKIEYLSYGQRSDYQCEPKSTEHSKWFYSFNDHQTGTLYVEHNGDSSIFCTPGNTGNSRGLRNDAGFICKRLKANTEQSHRETGEDAYRWDSQSEWHIKPRLRIDSSVAHSEQNPLVCNIKVVGQNGLTELLNVDIRARDFLTGEGGKYYNGNYIEEFPNGPGLIIKGDWGDRWWFNSRGTRTPQNEGDSLINHADIQVFWYGLCDMWIDYIRVDNDIAHDLFSEDPTNNRHREFESWLQSEAQDIACYNSGESTINFYVELVEFNNLPCIKRVNERLNFYKTCSKQLSVIVDLLCLYQSHISWDERGKIDSPQQIKDLYMDYTGAQEIFLGDPYPLISRRPDCWEHGKKVNSQIPSTLPKTKGSSILANIVSAPSDYDAWLQAQLDTVCSFYKGGWYDTNHLAGVFCYLMKSGNAVSRITDKPFYAMLQAHQWVGSGEVDREPTVEEQDMMTNMAVSYGAKGIVYWGGASFYDNDCRYNFALWEHPAPFVTPRYENVYGQPKWNSLIATTARLKTWGPFLMSFDNTKTESYIYRFVNERNECMDRTYFKDIVSYKNGVNMPLCIIDQPDTANAPPPEGLVYECREFRYLQAAVFSSKNPDGNRYFMIVNKRCSPKQLSENDGERFIRVMFDQNSVDFSQSDIWEIIDLENPNLILGRFNKTGINPYVDLGWFDPGQGKIYKIVPVP